jgi:uncharacterized membrane protein
MMETHQRTLAKTISWRVIATFITGLLGWLFTGSATFALGLGLSDTFIKFFIYYIHERTWSRIKIGYKKPLGIDGDGI